MISTLDDRIAQVFLEAGLRYCHHRKPQWKNEISILFADAPDGSYRTVLVRVPMAWKTVEEHDDLFVEAVKVAVRRLAQKTY